MVDFEHMVCDLFAAFNNEPVTLYPPAGAPIATTPAGWPLAGIFNERFQELLFEGSEGAVSTMRTILDLYQPDVAGWRTPKTGWECDVSGRRWAVVDVNDDGVAVLTLHLREVPPP